MSLALFAISGLSDMHKKRYSPVNTPRDLHPKMKRSKQCTFSSALEDAKNSYNTPWILHLAMLNMQELRQRALGLAPGDAEYAKSSVNAHRDLHPVTLGSAPGEAEYAYTQKFPYKKHIQLGTA
jgi:hypothetical protein